MPISPESGSETLKNVKLSNGQSLLTPEVAAKIGPLFSERDPLKFLEGVMGGITGSIGNALNQYTTLNTLQALRNGGGQYEYNAPLPNIPTSFGLPGVPAG
jgi:hypothetical protein